MNKPNYINLISRYLSGEIDSEENSRLNAWLKTSENNQHLFEQYKKVYQNIIPSMHTDIPDIDQSWAELEVKIKDIDQNISANRTKKPINLYPIKILKDKSLRRTFFAIAACFLFFISYKIIFPQHYLTQTTKNSQKLRIVLSDNSIVNLNSDSKIKYLKSFSDSVRSVFLTGQAFFNITKGQRPFIVNTANARIKVMGTSFDIWTRNNKTKIIVKEGTVRFSNIDSQTPHQITLTANERSIINADRKPTSPETVDAEYLIGWLDSRFVFYKTPLSEIVEEIMRRYDVKIILTSDDLKNRSLTGTFEEQSIDSTLKYFCIALNLSYTLDGKNYYIKK